MEFVELCVDDAAVGRPLVAVGGGRTTEVGASRIGENVDIAEVGRSCLAANDAFLCAAIASFSDERLPAARTFPPTPGPTLTVKDDAALPALGLAGSFSRSCLLFGSRLFMMLDNVKMLSSTTASYSTYFSALSGQVCAYVQ